MKPSTPVKNFIYKDVMFVLALLLCIGAGFPPERTAKIEGTVTDNHGAVIPNVDVTLKLIRCKCKDCPKPDECTCCPDSRATQTNDEGVFSFTVSPGTYSIKAVKSGFAVAIVSDVEANDGETTSVKIAFGY